MAHSPMHTPTEQTAHRQDPQTNIQLSLERRKNSDKQSTITPNNTARRTKPDRHKHQGANPADKMGHQNTHTRKPHALD